MPDHWGGLLCRAVYVDSDTGERTTYELRGDRLRHIIGDHVAEPSPADSLWDPVRFQLPTDPMDLQDYETETSPGDYFELIRFLCDSLALQEPNASGDSLQTPGNKVRIYVASGGFVGIDGSSSAATVYFTVIVTPSGEVWSAYPGTSPFV
jgi:hypothetical protein